MRKIINGRLTTYLTICDQCGRVLGTEWIYVTIGWTAHDFCCNACYDAFVTARCHCSSDCQHCWHDKPNGKQCCHCGTFKTIGYGHGPFAPESGRMPAGAWITPTGKYIPTWKYVQNTPASQPPIWNPDDINKLIWNPDPNPPWNPLPDQTCSWRMSCCNG